MENKNNKNNKELSRYDDQINNRINFRMLKDKIVVNVRRQIKVKNLWEKIYQEHRRVFIINQI